MVCFPWLPIGGFAAEPYQFLFINDLHAELLRFIEFGAGLFPRHHIIRFRADAAAHFAAQSFRPYLNPKVSPRANSALIVLSFLANASLAASVSFSFFSNSSVRVLRLLN